MNTSGSRTIPSQPKPSPLFRLWRKSSIRGSRQGEHAKLSPELTYVKEPAYLGLLAFPTITSCYNPKDLALLYKTSILPGISICPSEALFRWAGGDRSGRNRFILVQRPKLFPFRWQSLIIPSRKAEGSRKLPRKSEAPPSKDGGIS